MENQKNKNLQKSFYFEDYQESETIIHNRKSDVKVLNIRVAFIFSIFLLLIFIFFLKSSYLLISKKNFHYSKNLN